MTGMISGGWGFVWSAYGVTVATLAIYTIALIVSHRRHVRELRDRSGGR